MFLKIRNKLARRYYNVLYKNRVLLSRYRGLRLLLKPSNHLDRLLQRGLPFEKQQLDFVLALVAEQGIEVFVDIGANLGLYSLTLASRSTALQKVIAIEPQVETFNHLCGNIYLNELDRIIETHNIGLSDHKGSVVFLGNVANTGTSRIRDTAPSSTKFHRFREESIQVDTLDALLGNLVDRKLLLKIDVEGHELKVLAGASETLRNNYCVLQIEILSDDSARVAEICEHYNLRHLHQIGYDHYFESHS